MTAAESQTRKEVMALIRYYSKRGWDWTAPVEFMIRRARGESRFVPPCEICPWRRK